MRNLLPGFTLGTCVWCVAHVCWTMKTTLAKGVTFTDFILPALPYTNYALDDVIVLPSNADYIEVALIWNGTEYNATLTEDFHLHSKDLSEPSFLTGVLTLRTYGTPASVVLNLATCLLPLPSTRSYRHSYFIINAPVSAQNKQSVELLFQSTGVNTTVSICPRNSRLSRNSELYGSGSATNLAPSSQQIPGAVSCIQMKIPHSDGLLLNNVSLLDGIEISADRPVSILAVSRSNVSAGNVSSMSAGEDTRSSRERIMTFRRSYKYMAPVKHWADQFVLLPSRDGSSRRAVKFSMLSLENITAAITTNLSTRYVNLTAWTPYYISLHSPEFTFIHVAGHSQVAGLSEVAGESKDTARSRETGNSSAQILLECAYTGSDSAGSCRDVVALTGLSRVSPRKTVCPESKSVVADDASADGNIADDKSVDDVKFEWLFVQRVSFITVICSCQAKINLREKNTAALLLPTSNTSFPMFQNPQTASASTSASTSMLFLYTFDAVTAAGTYKLEVDIGLGYCKYKIQAGMRKRDRPSDGETDGEDKSGGSSIESTTHSSTNEYFIGGDFNDNIVDTNDMDSGTNDNVLVPGNHSSVNDMNVNTTPVDSGTEKEVIKTVTPDPRESGERTTEVLENEKARVGSTPTQALGSKSTMVTIPTVPTTQEALNQRTDCADAAVSNAPPMLTPPPKKDTGRGPLAIVLHKIYSATGRVVQGESSTPKYVTVDHRETATTSKDVTVDHDNGQTTTSTDVTTSTTPNQERELSTTMQDTTVTKSQSVTRKPSAKGSLYSPTGTQISNNDRFNMVVDIVHTEDGRPMLSDNPQNNGLPTYVVNSGSELDLFDNHGGKSLAAIIISLVAALLAVAIFILMFVLSDFMSRRNQIRNTRIRPFVSYY